jgi:WD40 repeat protein
LALNNNINQKFIAGHTAGVLSVAFSPDGTHALSGSDDQTVKLWEVSSGLCLKTLKGHTDSVLSVAFSPDGTHALSGSDDQTVKLWEVDSGLCLKTLEGHTDSVLSVAFSPDGTHALSGSDDQTVKLWEVSSGLCLKTLKGHTDSVLSVAFSPDGTHALSSSADQTVKLWEVDSGLCLKTLEGHTAGVLSVAFSPDGTHALSSSADQTIKLWEVDSGLCLKNLEGHTASVWSVAFSPDSVSSAAQNGRLLQWLVDVNQQVVAGEATSTARQYTNAKVLLVGDSGVGKTGLALRLTEDRFEATLSTDAHWATQLNLPHSHNTDDLDREIWLWDFAGQADYRLIHQIFMDETALAVLVFNPQSENPFEGLGQWDRALCRAAQRPFKKLLVAGRCDRGNLMVSRSHIDQFVQERNFTQYLETSALEGDGCPALKQAIIDQIDWKSIPYTSSPRIFKLLKDEILKLRDQGIVLLRISELKQQLDLRLPQERYTLAQLRTVVRLLASPGIIWQLEFGDFVLLQPEWINKYAAAVIRSVRAHMGEIGIISETQVLNGDLNYTIDHRPTAPDSTLSLSAPNPYPMQRLDRPEEEIVLRAMHQTFVDRGICTRTPTAKGIELIFPSYFKRELPEDPGHPPILITYCFNGFLDEIYATLVVQLHNTKAFDNGDLWRFAADFHSPSGARMGLKLERRNEGAGEISVYFDPAVSDDLKVMFTKYVHEHLLEKGKDVLRLRHFVCPHCGHTVKDSDYARKILEEEGHPAQIRCQSRRCDQLFDLWDLIEQKFASPEFQKRVRDLETKAKAAIDNESKELILVGHAFSIAGEAGQIFRPTPNSDRGIDGEIEFKDLNGNASGQRVYLQLKSGDSYLYERKDGKEIFTIKSDRLRKYWQQHAYPVMLVIRTSDGEIRWMDISAYLKAPDQSLRGERRAANQIIFKGEPFTAANLQRMRDRLIPHPSQ